MVIALHQAKSSPKKPAIQTGFTLLEIVLVLFLIGLVSSTVFLFTDNIDQQAKYDETKRRMEIIRQAIVGDPTRRLNGQTEISGFAADMGRLPGCLRELVEPNHCIDASGALTAWAIDASTGIGSGWRGPYIQVTPESDGSLRFRDGYSNTATTNSGQLGTNTDASANGEEETNHGWTWRLFDDSDTLTNDTSTAISIRLQSFGPTDGTNKYPQGTVSTINKLVTESDYVAELANWNNINIELINESTNIITIPADSLRVKLSYAKNGSLNAWPNTFLERENSDYLSETFPPVDVFIGTGSNDVSTADAVAVPSGSVLNGNELTVGSVGEVVFPPPSSENISVNQNDIVLVPNSSSLSGTVLTIGSDGKVFFPNYTINTGLQFPNLISSYHGQYSVIIACDDILNESAVSGQRFDGDCSRYGTDAAPISYNPLTPPYLFQIPSRSIRVNPPSISWVIQ